MSIPRITDHDIAAAFGRRQNSVGKFRDIWEDSLGHLFECPGSKQLKTWLQLCGYDWEILAASISDLRSRTASHPPLATYEDPYEYAIRYFSAALIRRTRQKYGHVRPTQQREAA